MRKPRFPISKAKDLCKGHKVGYLGIEHQVIENDPCYGTLYIQDIQQVKGVLLTVSYEDLDHPLPKSPAKATPNKDKAPTNKVKTPTSKDSNQGSTVKVASVKRSLPTSNKSDSIKKPKNVKAGTASANLAKIITVVSAEPALEPNASNVTSATESVQIDTCKDVNISQIVQDQMAEIVKEIKGEIVQEFRGDICKIIQNVTSLTNAVNTVSAQISSMSDSMSNLTRRHSFDFSDMVIGSPNLLSTCSTISLDTPVTSVTTDSTNSMTNYSMQAPNATRTPPVSVAALNTNIQQTASACTPFSAPSTNRQHTTDTQQTTGTYTLYDGKQTSVGGDQAQSYTQLLTSMQNPIPSASNKPPNTQSIANTQYNTLDVAELFSDPSSSGSVYNAPFASTKISVHPKDKHWRMLRGRHKTRTAFANQVFLTLFSKEEMLGKNCQGKGKQGKQALDSAKLLDVKTITLYHHPLDNESEHDAWRACERAIDGGLRKLAYKQLQQSAPSIPQSVPQSVPQTQHIQSTPNFPQLSQTQSSQSVQFLPQMVPSQVQSLQMSQSKPTLSTTGPSTSQN
jgi:uncharacterized protein YukE